MRNISLTAFADALQNANAAQVPLNLPCEYIMQNIYLPLRADCEVLLANLNWNAFSHEDVVALENFLEARSDEEATIGRIQNIFCTATPQSLCHRTFC